MYSNTCFYFYFSYPHNNQVQRRQNILPGPVIHYYNVLKKSKKEDKELPKTFFLKKTQ